MTAARAWVMLACLGLAATAGSAQASGDLRADSKAAAKSSPSPRLSAWDPGRAPDRLTDFVDRINRSVVTIYCGNGLGSGWAAVTGLSESQIASGYRSYLITNAHVIRGCTSANTQLIEIKQNGVSYPARVWTWDWDYDLAGVLTTAELPPLKWGENPKPRVGQWVAAFGSPFGLAGSATFGAVSYVGPNDLISSAPINPGNSGGPLVDNEGRVIGINTAGVDGTNGIGIVQGTPLMCLSTHDCRDSNTVWLSGNVPAAPGRPTVRQDGNDMVVTWSPPASNGGRVIQKFLVEASPGGKQCSAFGSTSTSCRIRPQGKSDPGLQPGVTYTFSVQAINDIGAGMPASTAPIVFVGVPGVVLQLRASPVRRGATVTWQAPVSAPPGTTYEYRIDRRAWKKSSSTTLRLTGLPSGRPLVVTVRAVTTAGVGPAASTRVTPL